MVKLWSVSGFWRETQKRTDLEMKWVLIIEQVWAMSRSERKRSCVFFFLGVGKKSGVCEVGFGSRGFSEKRMVGIWGC